MIIVPLAIIAVIAVCALITIIAVATMLKPSASGAVAEVLTALAVPLAVVVPWSARNSRASSKELLPPAKDSSLE